MMKKIILCGLLSAMLPCQILAQDDMYFVPSKSAVAKKSSVQAHDDRVTYSGSNRDVDEYNRNGKFWSHYQKIGTDEKGNDIIEFQKGRGVYPDSTYIDTTFVGRYYDTIADDGEYEYTARMSRWDGFYDPWFYSYRWQTYPYWHARRGWYDPWYRGYSAFYDPWYDPWYYGYYGYGYPYGYYSYGWHSPYYYGGYYGWNVRPVYSYHRGHSGTLGYYDRSNYRGRSGNYGSVNRSNSRGRSTYRNRSNNSRGDVTFGSRRNSATYSSPMNTGTRNTPTYSSPSRSSGNSSFGSGSFGSGSRSSGSSSGGSRFGGSFGGGRR